MNQPNQLSLEQEFKLKRFADQVKLMSREQAQGFLIELHRQIMIKKNVSAFFTPRMESRL